MKIISTINEIKDFLKDKNNIGFVPTMGALHNGHVELLKEARNNNKLVVLSIFVNPTQFLEGEDLDKYPRTFEADKRVASLCDVDVIFYPDINEMYGNDEISLKAPNVRGSILEGYERPGHFDGVLSVVLKLFNIIKPSHAYFGRKDAQQLALIKLMVDNLFLDINIVEVSTQRDKDGLALSSRNRYLSETDRLEALRISKSLKNATNMIMNKEYSVDVIKDAILNDLSGMQIDYVEIVSREFRYIEQVKIGDSLILIALHVNGTRLIDNMWV
jgi:pantoate--beta-alanine ligase